jgi:hypothetical protein
MVNNFGILLCQPYRLKIRGFLTWGVAPSYVVPALQAEDHQILAPKQSDPTDDTRDLEQQIDNHRDEKSFVSTGLTEEEISIVENC